MTNIYMDFPDWLEKELLERDMRPADLARKANTSSAVISRILNRERKPAIETLIAIAEALDLPRTEVFAQAGLLGNETSTQFTEDVEKYARLIAKLPPEDQEIIDTFIQSLIDRRRGKDLEGSAPANQPAK